MAKKSAEAVAETAGVVRVANVVRVAVSSLQVAPYNPKVVSARKLEELKASIRAAGFIQPVVVQRESRAHGANVIVAGHQRVRAVREIAVEDGTEVPEVSAIVLDLDDRAAKKLNLAMRDKAEIDDALLTEMLEDLQAEQPIADDELQLMGFEDRADLDSYLVDEVDPGDSGREPTPATQAPSLKLDFTSRELRDAVKAAIGAKAKKDEPSGDALARALQVRAPAKRAKKK